MWPACLFAPVPPCEHLETCLSCGAANVQVAHVLCEYHSPHNDLASAEVIANAFNEQQDDSSLGLHIRTLGIRVHACLSSVFWGKDGATGVSEQDRRIDQWLSDFLQDRDKPE